MKKKDNTELFERMPVPKAVLAMAVPTIISQLIVLIYNIADTFFIGQTNDPCMVAGASLILPVFNISLAISALAGVGGSAVISKLLGEYRPDEAKKVCSFSIYVSLLISIVYSLSVLVFMDPLMHLLGAETETFEYARTYAFMVIVLGGIPTIMSNVFSQLVRSTGESGKAGFGITMGGIINIFLDPLFMFVLLPDGKEILGAGIATCISNCIACAYYIAVIIRLSGTTVLGLVPIKDLPEKKSLRNIFAVGFPAGLSILLFDMDYIVIDRLMSGYSHIALASVGIVLKAERLPLNVGIGICQGMVPVIAYNYASRNYLRMKKVKSFAYRLGLVFAVFSIIMYELAAPYIMRFFINDADTIALGTNFLRIRCIATILMFMSFFHVHLFNAYVRGKEALFLGVMRWAVFNIPMLFILNSIIGMYGIVWAQTAGDVLTVIISIITHRRFIRRYVPELSGSIDG